MPELRIECSGFSYRHWKDAFYPAGLPQGKWFAYYCTVFSTVELNVTFYRLPLATTFDAWYSGMPSDFVFSLKGSRFITHKKRLLEPETPVASFFERALRLGEKLKVVLWQFSPGFPVALERLKRFLELLSRYPVRNALEFRHESWITDAVIDLCTGYNVSLCMADWPACIADLPVTSDIVYLRRHGAGGTYASYYSTAELRNDAGRMKGYAKAGKDVFIYFNNDACGYAPRNAQELMKMVA